MMNTAYAYRLLASIEERILGASKHYPSPFRNRTTWLSHRIQDCTHPDCQAMLIVRRLRLSLYDGNQREADHD